MTEYLALSAILRQKLADLWRLVQRIETLLILLGRTASSSLSCPGLHKANLFAGSAGKREGIPNGAGDIFSSHIAILMEGAIHTFNNRLFDFRAAKINRYFG